MSTWTPIIALHTTLALSSLMLGPMALWARLGRAQRPGWHRASGYAFVTCMAGTALSAVFIKSHSFDWLGRFGPIHLLILLTLGSLVQALWALRQGRILAHRRTMISLYITACLVTGAFTLLPQRLLGQTVWGQWLGWL